MSASRRGSSRVGALAAAALALLAQDASAAPPPKITRIPVTVQPYYAAAPSPERRPVVEVGRTFNHALASTERNEIAGVRDLIAANPGAVTPMTMMVLAIRLYDVGLRDDAVFWFYAAKARYITLEDTVDVNVPALKTASEAVKNFARLGGPYFNGYAFCDPPGQHATMIRALDWVEKNPYETIFMKELTGKAGDRKANIAESIKRQRKSADDERAKFGDKKFAAGFAKARKKNKADAMFCWKS